MIVPVFNRATLVQRALESVFAQTFDDYELIVVDDGSTDRTPAVLSGYGDRIKVLKRANGGPASARNAGITIAQGLYVVFLDSDDVWFPWTLEVFDKLINEHANPCLIACRAREFQSIDEIPTLSRERIDYRLFESFLSAPIEDQLFLMPSGVAVRNDQIKRIQGFDTELIVGEDFDLWLRLGHAKGFILVQSPPMFGRLVHDGNLSRQVSDSYAGLRRISEKWRIGAYGKKKGESDRALSTITSLIVEHINIYWNIGQRKLSVLTYLRSFLLFVQARKLRYLVRQPLSFVKRLLIQ